jgi:hypothetical protein
MNKIFAAAAGMMLIGAIGAGTVQAQSVNIRIEKNDRTVEINAGHKGGHYITVKKKVWVEGCYQTVCEDVWVPAVCQVINEQVYVPASCRIVEEQVWVPGQYVTVQERRVDAHGCVFHVSVRKFVAGHYECRKREVHVAAHYETRQRHVDIPGHFEKRERKVYVAGHFKVVEERVFVADKTPEPRRQVQAPRTARSTR